MGDVHIEQPADDKGESVTPASDAIDLAEKVGAHGAQIAQHDEKLAEHDGLIQAAADSAKFAHDRIDSIASNESSRVDELGGQVAALANDIAELKAQKVGEELGEVIDTGAEAITEPVGEAAQTAEDAAVEAPASVENVAEKEETESKGFMGFLRKLNIH